MPAERISKRVVDTMKPGETVWDSEVAGFGVRCQARARVYMLKTRIAGQQRWFTIGKHGAPWTPDTVRRRALDLLGAVARGDDPNAQRTAKHDTTLRELAGVFLREHVEAKRKARTGEAYRDILERLVIPRLGRRPAVQVKHVDVARLHHELRDTPYQANRTLAVLSKMFSFAEQRGLIPKGTNPCEGVEKYKEEARDRFLDGAELARLGAALEQVEERQLASPHAIAAIRLLLLTGARLSEVLTLRWEHVDLERAMLFLADSQNGQEGDRAERPGAGGAARDPAD